MARTKDAEILAAYEVGDTVLIQSVADGFRFEPGIEVPYLPEFHWHHCSSEDASMPENRRADHSAGTWAARAL